jgi:phage tail sheath protein FI
MPQALTYPGVYVEEFASGVRTIAGVATSIALFIGWAKKGPIDKASRVFSFADFEREYGGLDGRTLLGHSVMHFFNNGGTDAYIIRLAKSGDTTGAAASATAEAAGFTFEASSPGDWAEDYTIRVTPRPDAADRFKIEALIDGAVVESFENLTRDPANSRFVTDYIKDRSRLFKVTVVPTSDPTTEADGPFEDGADGDVLDPAEDAVAVEIPKLFDEGKPADKIDIFNIVCVPGMISAANIATLAQKCAERRAFLIVDCPEGSTRDSVEAALDDMIGSAASYCGFYFPWALAPDPLKEGAITPYPPCGFVAGIYARTDARRGVWKAPAGTDATVNGIVGFQDEISDAENGSLNPKAINCLRTLPTYGNVVWGARTLDGDNNRGSEWKYIPVRRMALYLEESLFRGTQWVVFEPNDEPLWAQIRLNINAFLQTLFRQGAFQGSTPREAYFVKCDRTTTTQADINMGIVNIHVGFAPLKPAEFVVLRIQQIAGELAS